LEDFCCIDFDDKACIQKDRPGKTAADSVCIQISGCDKTNLYIIEKYAGTLDVNKVNEKIRQIRSTMEILSNTKLLGNFVRNFESDIKTFIVCDKYGVGGRDRVYQISKPTVVYQYRELDSKNGIQRIIKYVYEKKG
jgi:hypothetical protein